MSSWLQSYKNGQPTYWAKRATIIIDSSKVDEDLVNFPLKLELGVGSGLDGVDTSGIINELDSNTTTILYDFNNLSLNYAEWELASGDGDIYDFDEYYIRNNNNSSTYSVAVSNNSFAGGSNFELKAKLIQAGYQASKADAFLFFFRDTRFTTTSPNIRLSLHAYSGDITYNKFDFAVYNQNVVLYSFTSRKYNYYTDRGKWFHAVVKREGDVFSFKHWLTDDPEPEDWDIVVTLNDLPTFSGPVTAYTHTNAYAGFDDITLINVSSFIATNDSANKLAVTDSSGVNQLYVENSYWNITQDVASLWVKVPFISSSSDTTLYLYYDNTMPENDYYVGVSETLPALTVWEDYSLVLHFVNYPLENYPCVIDSTTSGNKYTPYNVDYKFYNYAFYTKDTTVSGLSLLPQDSGTLEAFCSHNSDYIGYLYSTTLSGYVNANEFFIDSDGGLVINETQGVQSKSLNVGYDDGTERNYSFVWGSDFRRIIVNGDLLTISNDDVGFEYTVGSGSCHVGNSSYSLNNGLQNNIHGNIRDLFISTTARSAAWLKASTFNFLDELVSFHMEDSDIRIYVDEENIWTNDPYIYRPDHDGLYVYDMDTSLVNFISYPEGFNSVWANDSYVYLATTSSGIFRQSVTTITGSAQFSSYKYYPNITSNAVRYMSGGGDYLCAVTFSGVDRYKISNNSRQSHSLLGVNKCYQTSKGDYYYSLNNFDINGLDDVVSNWKYCVVVYLNNRVPVNDYILTLEIPSSIPIHSNSKPGGVDFRVVDDSYNTVSFNIESWEPHEISIFLNLRFNTKKIFLLFGNERIFSSTSTTENVYLFSEDFDYSFPENLVFSDSGYNYNSYYIADGKLKMHCHSNSYTVSITSTNYFSNCLFECRFRLIQNTYLRDFDMAIGFSGNPQCYVGCTVSTDEYAHRFYSGSSLGTIYGTELAMYDYKTISITNSKYLQMSELGQDLLVSNNQLLSDIPKKFFVSFTNASTEPDLEIDWIRVRSLNAFPESISYTFSSVLDTSTIFPPVKLYANYYNTSSSYEYNFKDLPSAAVNKINDIFVTENTSSIDDSNTIFLATDNGVVVLEENSVSNGDFNKKYYRVEEVSAPTNLSLPEFYFWLDASATSTITLDESGNVEMWEDRTLNGRKLQQTNPNLRPNYISNSVVGDGVDKRLYSLNIGILDGTVTAYSIFFVTTPKEAWSPWFPVGESSSGTAYYSYDQYNNNILRFDGNTGTTSSPVAPIFSISSNRISMTETRNSYAPYLVAREVDIGTNTPAVVSFVRDSSGYLRSSVNFEPQVLGKKSSIINLTMTNGLRSPASYRYPTDCYKGYIHEIIFLTYEVDYLTRCFIEGYLANKWLLTQHLSENHPYKNYIYNII